MPYAGDVSTASITVEPYDGTTAVALAVTSPSGAVSTPVVNPVDGGTWTAPVTYSVAGVWRLTWTITGTGAGVRHEVVPVGPVPGAVPPGRVYATTTQLANYLGTAPPVNAARLLLRASELLDSDILLPAVYEVDLVGLPTDPEVAAAFANCVCAQVEFWGEVGEENDVSGPLQGVSIGSVNIQYGAGDNRSGPSYYAPKIARYLGGLPEDKFRMVVTSGQR
ncbi:hypothetical protein ACWF94_06200 [Streptomyces sp. NPDC055078]